MAVRIVLDGPGRGVGPRLGRALGVVAGLPLLVAGVAGLYGVILIGIFFIYVKPDQAKDQRDAIVTGAVCAAAALIGLGLGLRLLRGRRRLVLFLRRFGFDDATRAVSFAAAGAIGRSWRLVTLDDEKVTAVGGATGPRRLAGVTALIALVPLAYVVWWMRTHTTDSLFSDFKMSGGPSNSTDIATVLANAIGTAMVSALFVAMILTFFVLTGMVAGPGAWGPFPARRPTTPILTTSSPTTAAGWWPTRPRTRCCRSRRPARFTCWPASRR
jgi:hypothetical protein